MTQTWQIRGPLAPGGTVTALTPGPRGEAWLATAAGLLRASEHGWRPLPTPRPVALLSALAASGSDCWAGGLGGQIARSVDAGTTWELGWTDQVDTAITGILPSPRYATDRVLLAGTAGAGVLRSTDGGRRWLLSNFGLRSFTVLALAAAPWAEREPVFAGTLDGVYRSSGGGRAWKPAGLEGMVVQALAYGPDGTLLAGTESGGLWRSDAACNQWQPLTSPLNGLAINALLALPTGWLAADDTGTLWHSADALHWQAVWQGQAPIIALTAVGATLYAGMLDAGLLISHNGGQHWQADKHLAARGFARFQATGTGLLALAPTEGAWHSRDSGRSWQRLAEANAGQPLLAWAAVGMDTAAGEETFLLLPDGVWRAGAHQPTLPASTTPIVALAAAGPALWAASAAGQLWRANIGQQLLDWQLQDTPTSARAVPSVAHPVPALRPLLLEGLPDGHLVLVGYDEPGAEVLVWRWDGSAWLLWLRSAVAAGHLPTAAFDLYGGWLALGPDVWRLAQGPGIRDHGSGGQQPGTIEPPLAVAAGEWVAAGSFVEPVVALAGASDGPGFALAGSQLYQQTASGAWQPLPWPAAAARPVLLASSDAGLLVLDEGGYLWQYG